MHIQQTCLDPWLSETKTDEDVPPRTNHTIIQTEVKEMHGSNGGMKKTSQHYHRQVECMVMLGSGKRRSYLGMSLVPNTFPTKVLRTEPWTSLVVQWAELTLPMREHGSSLVWEDATCCAATKPMCAHSY